MIPHLADFLFDDGVSGRSILLLMGDMTNWKVNRSIIPVGTVSGAPKVRAMELIAELERENEACMLKPWDTSVITQSRRMGPSKKGQWTRK